MPRGRQGKQPFLSLKFGMESVNMALWFWAWWHWLCSALFLYFCSICIKIHMCMSIMYMYIDLPYYFWYFCDILLQIIIVINTIRNAQPKPAHAWCTWGGLYWWNSWNHWCCPFLLIPLLCIGFVPQPLCLEIICWLGQARNGECPCSTHRLSRNGFKARNGTSFTGDQTTFEHI